MDILATWKELWFPVHTAKMPLGEKKNGETVPYPFEVKKVDVDGIEIAYIDEGDNQGDVLLFVHGMGSAIPAWRKNIPELKNHFRCIALDLPGHGHSSKEDHPFTMDFYSRVVTGFMHTLGLSQTTLVGHSMGGQIAVTIALREPALIARLILISPAGFEPYSPTEKQMLIGLGLGVAGSANAFTMHKFNFLTGFCGDQRMAGDLLRRLPLYQEHAPEFGRMILRSIEGMLLESVNEHLGSLIQPCLILVGKDDKVSPYTYMRPENYHNIIVREAARIRNATVTVFDPGCHFLEYQRPETFNMQVLQFLKKEVLKNK
ncbi:MAG TPA: alpha/beta fold hydrolase [Flavobacterium sp.]|jgi:pimeloyl-ACP methyl ester carboxylesterase